MDLYIVLGVTREASTAEIKRAYRRLARQLHPDINPGDREAALRFEQILQAYETLIDPDLRRTYDSGKLGSGVSEARVFGFSGFDFSAAAGGPRATTFGDLFEDVFNRQSRRVSGERGADLHVQTTLPFEASWRGAEWPVNVTRQDTCRACAGAGTHRTAESRCHTCEGTGAVRSARGHMVFSKACPTCGGSGRLRQTSCDTCHGQGVEWRVESLHVVLPAGIASGTRIRVAGKGHAGARGGPRRAISTSTSSSIHIPCLLGSTTICTCRCRSPSMRPRLAHASRCRRQRGRPGSGFRRGRRLVSASGFASAACRRRVARAATSWSKCG